MLSYITFTRPWEGGIAVSSLANEELKVQRGHIMCPNPKLERRFELT